MLVLVTCCWCPEKKTTAWAAASPSARVKLRLRSWRLKCSAPFTRYPLTRLLAAGVTSPCLADRWKTPRRLPTEYSVRWPKPSTSAAWNSWRRRKFQRRCVHESHIKIRHEKKENGWSRFGVDEEFVCRGCHISTILNQPLPCYQHAGVSFVRISCITSFATLYTSAWPCYTLFRSGVCLWCTNDVVAVVVHDDDRDSYNSPSPKSRLLSQTI